MAPHPGSGEELAENEPVDQAHEQGVEDGPEIAEHRSCVANLEVTNRQESQRAPRARARGARGAVPASVGG